MKKPIDVELRAVKRIVRALTPLSRETQQRIMQYVISKYRTDSQTKGNP